MKISTKRGDDGTTYVPGINRVKKDEPIVEYLGTVDELQSYLGLIDHIDIEQIQEDLYDLMSFKYVEPWFDTEIPQQTEFILPKGPLHVARTICRRAERRGVSAGKNVKYLNRLSDYLYKLAIENGNI